MQVNADLHIHSCFSMATSRRMVPENLIDACVTKGISVLGSGDALHPEWQLLWAESIENDRGILVIPTAEVEDQDRVHHLIIMPDFEGFSELRSMFIPFSRDILNSGRPHVRLTGGRVAGMVHQLGGIIGPAHAFTPWTSVFAYFNSIRECYPDEPVDFLELGLSADNSYGAAIPELYGIPFLTNSDAHSPEPAKFGREFTRLFLNRRTVPDVLSAVKAGHIELNAGFFPEEGKYNRTACTRCYEQYTLVQAGEFHWRCPKDHGLIKKGVRDRALELSIGPPRERPPYLHMIPLGEIIRKTQNASSTMTKKCLRIYSRLISVFGNEIEILTVTPVREIREVDIAAADAIDALRNNRVSLQPGGGGRFGTFTIQGPENYKGPVKCGLDGGKDNP
jgi:uncharacterized protein (TIGR00375 family)